MQHEQHDNASASFHVFGQLRDAPNRHNVISKTPINSNQEFLPDALGNERTMKANAATLPRDCGP